ncbi:Bug family tripartite tricarboxylate transporter substrate binding protein [Hydrogenophaga sp. OTU3427]|uniref:Bug family tripartite tricarboxylate transporter substrate binding protein n=1 Tax=Hydrogenophaga sp. OTU3427 TaxID=3043856 RepID=UPI00313E6CF7
MKGHAMLNKRFVSLLMALSACMAPAAALAQWPDKPIKIVVAYPAGSTGDNVLRLMSDGLRARLGQPVVIENRSGAGGNIAASQVTQAKPDGYTLLLGAANNFAANQFLYKDLGFDPLLAFEPVIALVDVPAVLFINAQLVAKNYEEFTAAAKASGGRMAYGSPGTGTPPHLAAELINQAAGWGLLHVPYRGSPSTVAALLANEIQLILAGAGVGLQHVKAGKLRAIAVGSSDRLSEFPQVPTLRELGLGQIKASTWWGVAAPKGTPREVVERLRQAFAAILADPKVKEQLRQLGSLPVGGGTRDLAVLIQEDAAYWGPVIKKMGVQVE